MRSKIAVVIGIFALGFVVGCGGYDVDQQSAALFEGADIELTQVVDLDRNDIGRYNRSAGVLWVFDHGYFKADPRIKERLATYVGTTLPVVVQPQQKLGLPGNFTNDINSINIMLAEPETRELPSVGGRKIKRRTRTMQEQSQQRCLTPECRERPSNFSN